MRDILNTPWKISSELKRIMLSPFMFIFAMVHGIELAAGSKFYGLPKLMRHRQSRIVIGANFENRNWVDSNPLGINHATILCTWKPGASIVIGDHVGISGGTICAAMKVSIGQGTLVGANCTIIDTDFHPLKSALRRYDTSQVSTRPIEIGKNVFIGLGTTILKGVSVGDNCVIGAGSVVTRSLPANSMAAGNPAKVLKRISNKQK